MASLMVTGSRELDASAPASDALRTAAAALGEPTPTLVHGQARGADRLCADLAGSMGWPVLGHPARWSEHGPECPPWHAGKRTCRAAGHRRNREMLATGPDLVLALPAHPRQVSAQQASSSSSRGTWGAVDMAMAMGIPVVVLWKGLLWPGDEAAAAMLARVGPTGSQGELPVAAHRYPRGEDSP